MGRSVLVPACLITIVLLTMSSGRGADQTPAVRDAVAAMQRGDFPSAEKILRLEVQAHSDDAWALSLLGVALDNQKRIPEADAFHRRAVALSPHAAEILNNYGTHLWNAGQYDQAETIFAKGLSAAPGYFQVLYNLGVMATYTGHYQRAHEVLEIALRQQPENVDVLYRLACVEEASKQWEAAVMRLASAAKLNPRRADVQRLLAVTTSELGALNDAAAAWDRYLKLAPNDDVARRERGYTAAKMGKFEQAAADLEWYVARHPEDPVGHYELGQAARTVNMAQSLAEFDKALALDPAYLPARSARGDFYSQQGKPEAAVKDLELAVSQRPDDALNLDRLGQTYQALDRTDDAIRVLRKAAELAPEDSKTLLHLGRALADSGRTDESKAVLERFRQLGPEKKQGVPAGLVEYLGLPPAERRAEYRERVEKSVRDNPEDPDARIVYLRLVLEDGPADKVAAAAKGVAALKPGAAVLGSAGHALLEAGHFALAKELLAQAAAANPAGDLALDLAIATFRTAGAKPALVLLDRVPESERSGNYYLARAQMLDAAGNSNESAAALAQAFGRASERPDLYQQVVAFLIRKGQTLEALKSIEEAARILPENREILLMKATTLEFAGQTAVAEGLLTELQDRWPEWAAIWGAHGMILDTHGQYEQARRAMETANALGARGPEVYYFLADSALRSGHAGKDAAEAAIRQALALSPDDPWIQALGGRIALSRGENDIAVEREQTAIRLNPSLVEAHDGLAQAYGASGRKREADAELVEMRKIQQSPASAPPYLTNLFVGALFKKDDRPTIH